MAGMNSIIVVVVALCVVSSAAAFVKEDFTSGWQDRWVFSDWKKDEGLAGKWLSSAGEIHGGDDESKGAMTSQDAHFYAMSLKAEEPFNNQDKDLVVQFSVKFPQGMDCGGGYLKLFPKGIDPSTLSGDTDYSIMFGPDVCGSTTKKTHVIFNYKGKNIPTKKEITCESDRFTHVYTLVIHPDNTYEVKIDGEEKSSGSMYDDWDMLPPKMIRDEKAKKPEDWVDDEFIDDPEDKKPANYDDTPAQIADPDAEKPDDWDDEADGEWDAPMIDNPEYKGPWKPRRIPNPEYTGEWEHPLIPNPEYFYDDKIYLQNDIEYVGFELWQVKSGAVFDNIIVTDSLEEAEEMLELTLEQKEAEKKMADERDAEQRRKAEEERKKEEANVEKTFDEFEDDEDEEDSEDETKDEL